MTPHGHPGPLHGAAVETYDDHRVAASFATLGLKVLASESTILPACGKPFPNLFQKLAAPFPTGPGAGI